MPRAPGIIACELLGDGAALRVAQDMGRIEVQIIQELRQIAGKLLHTIGSLKCAAAPMPAQIWHNDAVAPFQGGQHALIHRSADHQAVDEQERWTSARLLDEQRCCNRRGLCRCTCRIVHANGLLQTGRLVVIGKRH
jgi:hypothetical protein